MIRKVLLLGLLIGSLISCEPKEKVEPALSPIPHIEFKQIKDFDIRPRDSYWYDSLVTTITYKDGDADLGKEYGSPFKFDGSDYNYVVTLLVKRNGQYQQYIIPGTDQHEIPFLMFQVPLPMKEPTTIENQLFKVVCDETPKKGEITHYFKLVGPQDTSKLKYGDTLKLSIYVIDRALNKSNTIETTEFVY